MNLDLKIEEFEKMNKTKLTKAGKNRSAVARSAKQKGKAGERYFADLLSAESGMSFIRVPNSGAFVGQSNRDKLKTLSRVQSIIHLGDIICPEELSHHYIFESKNYADLPFHQLLNPGNCPPLIGWLEELLYDVESAHMYIKDKTPIGFLCVKITRKGSWIVGNYQNWGKGSRKIIIGEPWLDLPIPSLRFKHEIKSDILRAVGWDDDFYLTDFTTFIKKNKDALFEKI